VGIALVGGLAFGLIFAGVAIVAVAIMRGLR